MQAAQRNTVHTERAYCDGMQHHIPNSVKFTMQSLSP